MIQICIYAYNLFGLGLAKSPEMSMQIPLQKTVIKVLKLLEKIDLSDNSDSQVSVEYLNAMAKFISNMLQWEHNEHLKHEKYERLASVAVKIISLKGDPCASIFGRILFWLHGCDRQRFTYVAQSYSTEELSLVITLLLGASIETDWADRTTLWNNFLGKFVEISGLQSKG
jgi:hypothetical protein